MTDKKLIDRVQIIGIVLVSTVWALMAFKKGVTFSADSSIYSDYADLLIKHNFNYFDFLAQTNFVTPIALYSAWITIVATAKVLFGNNWGIAIVVINYIAAVFTLALILKATRMITGKPACVIFVSIALIFCYDFQMWISYVLADTLFASICFLIIYISLSLFQNPSEPQKRITSCLILTGIAIFFRPVSPPLIVFIFLSILLGFIIKLGTNSTNKRYSLIMNLTLFACVALTAVLLLHSSIMLNPENWPFQSFKGWILVISDNYNRGIVVSGRPETFHAIPNGILDYLLITLSKLLSFFAIDCDGYSKLHALISYVFFLPVYTLSAFSITLLYKKENGIKPINWWTTFSCFTFIVLFSLFHSLNSIDFDFRYRLPCLLPLVLLATLGLSELLEAASLKRKKSAG